MSYSAVMFVSIKKCVVVCRCAVSVCAFVCLSVSVLTCVCVCVCVYIVVVGKPRNFRRMYTTQCAGRWATIHKTSCRIGDTHETTDFNPIPASWDDEHACPAAFASKRVCCGLDSACVCVCVCACV